jgi:transcriptional regulator with XRE-family HTH domain
MTDTDALVDAGHPAVRRRRLGGELRRLRDAAGLSGPELARRLGWSQSKVSRMETADRRSALPDVKAWLAATSASPAETRRVVALAKEAQTEIVGLRALHRGALARRQREIIDLDAATASLRQFQPFVIPGVFHLEEYARACIVAANLTGETDVDAAVKTRLERGERLRDPSHSPYHAVVMESALRWCPEGAASDLLIRQWESIVEMASLEHVTVQVIATGAPMAALPQCGFTIFEWRQPDDPAMVLVETPAAEVTYTGAADLASFEEVWRRVALAAMSPGQSIRWLHRLIGRQARAGRA